MPRTAKPQRGPWRRFTLKLFWALLSGSGLRPFIYALRLGLFVLAMLPGFVPYFLFYLLSPNIKRGVAYGDRWRQTLDVYLPQKPAGAPEKENAGDGAQRQGDAKHGRGQRSPPSRSAQKREGCGRGSDTDGMRGGRSEGS